MAALTDRAYSGANDLALMRDLLLRARLPERITDYPGLADLHELLCLPAIQANTRLWFTDGDQLAAYVLVDAFDNLLFDVDPVFASAIASPDLYAALVEWGVGRAGETLDAVCREDDTERLALLERHGFVRQTVRTLRLARSLAGDIPEPALPPGFTIRPVAGHEEIEALVALHRAAFGTEHMTIDERRAIMSGPDYDPALDLVAVAPNGQLAAYSICAISRQQNARTGRLSGSIDPVATHPAYQRLGLARALLLTGMRLLKQRGMELAVLGTSSENAGMQAAAQAVGFRIERVMVWLSKPIRRTVSPQ